MRRNTLLLCVLVAAAVMAAPTPAPRPSGSWNTGWDKPNDPSGGCRFDRDGDKMTITVKGKGHGLDQEKGKLNVPHLLRDAAGDFAVQVRVAGDFRQGNLGGGLRRA